MRKGIEKLPDTIGIIMLVVSLLSFVAALVSVVLTKGKSLEVSGNLFMLSICLFPTGVFVMNLHDDDGYREIGAH